MKFTDQHKALLLTLLVTGTVLLSIFSFSLKKHDKGMAESYYEIEPEKELTEEELKVLEALDKLNNAKAETNKAFNESKGSNHFAQAYKIIAPPEDYVPKNSTIDSDAAFKSLSEKHKNEHKESLDKDALDKFNKADNVLKKQQEANNSKSTTGYSLTGRTGDIPIPVYLCEVNGKIVVNIAVNSQGSVVDAYINASSSTSSNDCLIEHALEYAKKSTFNSAPAKPNQIGTITFNFIGK